MSKDPTGIVFNHLRNRIVKYKDQYVDIDDVEGCRILKNLYLGCYEAGSMRTKGLQSLGFTHVLSIGNLDRMPIGGNFSTKKIQLCDAEDEDIQKHFSESSRWLHDALSNPRHKVFVHCWAGMSRSASLVMAYLIKYVCLDFIEAFETVRKSRFWIIPNSGFIAQLKQWSSTCGYPVDDGKFESYLEIHEFIAKRVYSLQLGTNMILHSSPLRPDDIKKILTTFTHIFGEFHIHTKDILFEIKLH